MPTESGVLVQPAQAVTEILNQALHKRSLLKRRIVSIFQPQLGVLKVLHNHHRPPEGSGLPLRVC